MLIPGVLAVTMPQILTLIVTIKFWRPPQTQTCLFISYFPLRFQPRAMPYTYYTQRIPYHTVLNMTALYFVMCKLIWGKLKSLIASLPLACICGSSGVLVQIR